MTVTERVELLDRRVRRLMLAVIALSVLVVALIGTLVLLSVPTSWWTAMKAQIWAVMIRAVPVAGFAVMATLMTLLMIHRQIPAIAHEVGRWFSRSSD